MTFRDKKGHFSYPPALFSFTLPMAKRQKTYFYSSDPDHLAVIILSASVYKLLLWSDRSACAVLYITIKDNLLKILSFNKKGTIKDVLTVRQVEISKWAKLNIFKVANYQSWKVSKSKNLCSCKVAKLKFDQFENIHNCKVAKLQCDQVTKCQKYCNW